MYIIHAICWKFFCNQVIFNVIIIGQYDQQNPQKANIHLLLLHNHDEYASSKSEELWVIKLICIDLDISLLYSDLWDSRTVTNNKCICKGVGVSVYLNFV